MAQTPDETRREIAETRARIAEAAEELEERIEETRDWKTLVGRYPLESAAAALGAGFIIGAIGAALFSRPRQAARATKRTVSTGRSALASVGKVLELVRPIITPAISAKLVDYMRKRAA